MIVDVPRESDYATELYVRAAAAAAATDVRIKDRTRKLYSHLPSSDAECLFLLRLQPWCLDFIVRSWTWERSQNRAQATSNGGKC